jgi:hypothetical protein
MGRASFRSEETSPDERFRLVKDTNEEDTSLYSDIDWKWLVVSAETGDLLHVFEGSFRGQHGYGETYSGVKRVDFGDGSVVAQTADGPSQREALPLSIELAEEGRKIRLRWKDGREELRSRRHPVEVLYDYEGDLVGDPDHPPRPKPQRAATPESPKAAPSPAEAPCTPEERRTATIAFLFLVAGPVFMTACLAHSLAVDRSDSGPRAIEITIMLVGLGVIVALSYNYWQRMR